MEMDVQVIPDKNGSEEKFMDHALVSLVPGPWNTPRDNERPRIGQQYQVELALPMSKSAYLSLEGAINDTLFLPVPTMWIRPEIKDAKLEPAFESLGDFVNINVQSSTEGDLKVKDEALMDVKQNGEMELPESSMSYLRNETKTEIHCSTGFLVPGCSCNIWAEVEEASFLLGLYMFGKNLVQIKTFVGSKSIGDILSYYYGTFYGSEKYQKWSQMRKMKNKKCIYGEDIFTGFRKQELLSRLLPHVDEESRKTVVKAANAFRERIMSLEECVLTLKASVGLSALVEAVAIGKGKQDLTIMSNEPHKSSQVAPVHSQLPYNKPFSTLSASEITFLLTGGERMSKARSYDLFWEAVWPRLLARGWHSEQPYDQRFAIVSTQSLVFLVPGIQKFSRRKLVKGKDYFDSVTDLLKGVASDPSLLELDNEAGNVHCISDKNGSNNELDSVEQDFPAELPHCYLQPRCVSRGEVFMNFTIVDTSLANGGATKVSELRSLPVNVRKNSTSPSDSDQSNGDPFEEIEYDYPGNISMHGKEYSNNNNKVDTDGMELDHTAPKGGFTVNGSSFTKEPVEILKGMKLNNCSSLKRPRKAIKNDARKKVKPSEKTPFPAIAKRRIRRKRLNAYKQQETHCKTVNSSILEIEPVPPTGNLEGMGTVNPPDPCHEEPECLDLVDVKKPILQGVVDPDPLMREITAKPECLELIDLKKPILQGAIDPEPLMKEITAKTQDDDTMALKTSQTACDSTSRRHSSRNRPLTAKALEALACGYLCVKEKRKNRGDLVPDKKSRRSQHARKPTITGEFRNGSMEREGDATGTDMRISNEDLVNGVGA